MIYVQINPLSPTTAISEMILILVGAALIGYLIGKWITRGRIATLEMELASAEEGLADCQSQHANLVKSAPLTASGIYTSTAVTPDNLKLVEGIGPKIEQLLNAHNIYTFAQLASSSPEHLVSILREGGERFQIHNPETWPKQAQLARDGHWAELESWQNELKGGR